MTENSQQPEGESRQPGESVIPGAPRHAATPRTNKFRALRPPLALGIGLLLGLCLAMLPPATARAAVDVELLAGQVATALKADLRDPKYKTMAFSRIRNQGVRVDVAEFIDFTNVMVVRARHLKVVDRSRLSLILKEQKIQLADFVEPSKYKELGQLAGVDLFIYGTFYPDALVLKGIDVQNSAIVWAREFPVSDPRPESAYLRGLGEGLLASLNKDVSRLTRSGIRIISFWELQSGEPFRQDALMDYLSMALTRDGRLKVVDRENLRLITAEQALNQEVFIDQKRAKRLGELYGVDGFIYGEIKNRGNGRYLASLKLMNIYNGVIEWADLISMEPVEMAASTETAEAPPGMAFIPGGPFTMGTGSGQREASPQAKIELPGYFMDLHEVSNAEYARFVKTRGHRLPVGWKGGYPRGQESYPVVGVNIADAAKYCAWAGKRLPSEAEWEKAARGTAGQNYPWNTGTFSPGFANTAELGRKAPMAVDEALRDISPYQVRHMAGNVREWVDGAFQPYGKGMRACVTHADGPCVVRGGSFSTGREPTPTWYRGQSKPKLAWPDVGFRCAKSK